MEDSVHVRERTPEDTEWIRETFVREWRGDDVGLADGTIIHSDEVPALVAWRCGERVGLCAYLITGDLCEIVALVCRPTQQGTGSAMLEAIEGLARQRRCTRLDVATTNDNIDALRFYQRRGFALTELHPKLMDEVRSRKPEVPLVGQYDIPISDVLVLSKPLG